MIREQAIIVEFEAVAAVQGLPRLLALPEQRRRALALVHYIVGARDDMEPQSLAMLELMERLLGEPEQVPEAQQLEGPLAPSGVVPTALGASQASGVAPAAQTPDAAARTSRPARPAQAKTRTATAKPIEPSVTPAATPAKPALARQSARRRKPAQP